MSPMRRGCLTRSKIISCRPPFVWCAALLVLCTAAVDGQTSLTLTNRPYRYRAKAGELVGFYPALEDPRNPVAADTFNKRMHAFLDDRRRDVIAARKENPLTLRVNYESAVTSTGVVSVRFESLAEERDMAHPSHHYISIIFDTIEQRELKLADLFVARSAWLKKVVELTRASLTAQDLPTTEDWIEKGTGANPGNFAVFRLTDQALEVFFPPYQVAPYTAGLQRVSIPLDQLRGVLQPRFLPRS